jgi:hypothetical protein
VIVAFPTRFPVTTPLVDTVALSVLELDQEKLWCGHEVPLASCDGRRAASWIPPSRSSTGAVTLTLATALGVAVPGWRRPDWPGLGWSLLIDGDGREPGFPSAFAATCDVPTANPVTTPDAEMLTILGPAPST